MKSRRALVLYALVVGTLALMLSWWAVFFVRQGEVLVARADRAGAALSELQAAAVREAAHQSLRMFLFEGAFLFAAFLAGVVLMLRVMRREVVLARAQREFLSAVTHELRTPLAAARLAIQSLALGRVGPEKRPRYLANAEADLARLSELVERVLEAARVSSGRARVTLERLDLAELVQRRAPALAAEVAPELPLELECGEGVTVGGIAVGGITVDADVAALDTILRNLFANAAKYAAGSRCLCVSTAREGRDARLAVRDFGPGIQGDPTRLFEPFTRGDGPLVASRPGVGLGLYLVSELARAHGGRVAARSPADGRGGLEVEVRLPLASSPGAPSP